MDDTFQMVQSGRKGQQHNDTGAGQQTGNEGLTDSLEKNRIIIII